MMNSFNDYQPSWIWFNFHPSNISGGWRYVMHSWSLQVPETLSEDVLGKMGAGPKSDVPTITPNELAEADGILLGFPTRFGMMAAQFKAFLDATGGLWRSQQLAGKPAGIFYSTGSQGGGQETTPWVSYTVCYLWRDCRNRKGNAALTYFFPHLAYSFINWKFMQLDGHYSAGSPWNDLRAHWIHIWSWHVWDGKTQGW